MSDALAAALMMQAQQGRGNDTYSKTRRMGEMLMAQGSQNRPTRHWMEDVNNNAQKLLGGFLMGRADDEQKSIQKATADKYARALGAPDEATRMAILQEDGGDPQAMIPLYGALLSGKMADERKAAAGQQAASVFKGAFGAPGAPTPLAPPQQGAAPDRSGFINMITPHAMKVSQETGLDPRLVIAQTALETGYGTAAPGNNYFGIKGPGQTLATQEAGPDGTLAPTQASFRTYKDPGESAADYANLLKNNSRYAPVLQAKGLDGQIDAMAKSGYATDPNYGAKLRQIASSLPPMDGAAPQAPGVTVQATPQMPAVPQVPRPQPTPDETARYAGLVQTGQMTVAQAKAALDADLDRRWGVEREQANKGFDVQRDIAKTADQRAYDAGKKPDALKKLDTEMASANAAIDRFQQVITEAGGGNFDTLINNPTNPKAQKIMGAFEAMKTALRSEAFVNTGVLQPGEAKMLDEMLLNPNSIRGYLANPEAYKAKLDEFRVYIGNKAAAAQKGYGTPSAMSGQQPPAEATPPPPAAGNIPRLTDPSEVKNLKSGDQFYTPDGRLKVVP